MSRHRDSGNDDVRLEFLAHPRHLLAQIGGEARASLSQNFLVNRGVLTKILDAVRSAQPATVVEIGAGLGHLTTLLAQAFSSVMAIDIDRDLIGLLTERFSDKPYVSVVRHDATRLSTLRELFEVRKPIVVVGNLPFGSSTKILFEVLDLELSVKKAVLMFQKEVARRLTASPPGRIYGALTVACKARARVDHLFDVSAGSFHPRPDVDGSVVAFTPRLAEGLGRCCLEPLSHILKAGFGARRKTVRNALKKGGMWQEVGDLDAMAEIDASRVRPEAVAPAVYYSLARQLCEKRGEHQRVRGLSR